jgi:hypothetical protein
MKSIPWPARTGTSLRASSAPKMIAKLFAARGRERAAGGVADLEDHGVLLGVLAHVGHEVGRKLPYSQSAADKTMAAFARCRRAAPTEVRIRRGRRGRRASPSMRTAAHSPARAAARTRIEYLSPVPLGVHVVLHVVAVVEGPLPPPRRATASIAPPPLFRSARARMGKLPLQAVEHRNAMEAESARAATWLKSELITL